MTGGAQPFLNFLGKDCKTQTSFKRGPCNVTCGTGFRPVERVVTVVQRQEGIGGKACSETPGRWNVKPEVCNRFACPTDPPEEPDETTDGPGGDGPRFGLDDTLGEGGRGGAAN